MGKNSPLKLEHRPLRDLHLPKFIINITIIAIINYLINWFSISASYLKSQIYYYLFLFCEANPHSLFTNQNHNTKKKKRKEKNSRGHGDSSGSCHRPIGPSLLHFRPRCQSHSGSVFFFFEINILIEFCFFKVNFFYLSCYSLQIWFY